MTCERNRRADLGISYIIVSLTILAIGAASLVAAVVSFG